MFNSLFTSLFYDAYQPFPDDDNCVGYPLVEPGTSCSTGGCSITYFAGYIALYMQHTPTGWKVSGYTTDAENDCVTDVEKDCEQLVFAAPFTSKH